MLGVVSEERLTMWPNASGDNPAQRIGAMQLSGTAG
jgi:hypothetical protein